MQWILKILNLEAVLFRFLSVSLEIRASSSGCRELMVGPRALSSRAEGKFLPCLALCLRPVAFLSFFTLSSQPRLSPGSQWPVDKSHLSCSHLPRSKHGAARGLKLWPRLQPLKSNCAIILTTVCKPLPMPALKHLLRLR